MNGSLRMVEPEVTFERLRPMFPDLGITRVANITGLDRIGIPVVTAMRPTSRSLAVSQGKGPTLMHAKASAVMESIELLHAERPSVPLRLASVRDLTRECATFINPDTLTRVGFERLRQSQAILWAGGNDISTGKNILVPYGYVALDDSLETISMPSHFPSNTNGLASGNALPETIAHALCELIERDAATLWFLGPERIRSSSAIDVRSVQDAECRMLLQRYADAGVDVCVFEITSDIHVPAFAAFIREHDPRVAAEQFSAVGTGCHVWPEIAMSRALTEAAQCRLTYIAGAREDLDRNDYGADEEKRADVDRYFALAFCNDHTVDAALRSESPNRSHSIEESVDSIVASLSRAGLAHALVVDLTSERFGIPVVRAIVPGLEGVHSEHGYVPGIRARRAMSEKTIAT